MRLSYSFIFFLTFLFSLDTFAKKFSSKFCEFELPMGWECYLEGSEYVCQSENADRKKEAIMVIAAKERGEQDNMDEFMAYLKKTKDYFTPGGKRQSSEVKNVKMTRINNHRWVDALHLESEVPGFYTRYLATVKEDLAIAVTFSVTKDLYSSYMPIVEKLISTLRVFRQRQNTSLSDLRGKKNNGPNFAQSTFEPVDVPPDLQVDKKRQRKSSQGSSSDLLWLLLVIGAILLFVILKKKKKN